VTRSGIHTDDGTMIEVRELAKSFTLHGQGGVHIPVFKRVNLDVAMGECVVLAGPSGAGKSTLLRALYANYKPTGGAIRVRHRDGWVNLTTASAREVLAVRRETIGYVSQFLRVIPRVSALDIVAEPLKHQGIESSRANEAAMALLARLNLPERLWHVPPATFSGGEQQRVNVARSFVRFYPIRLLDEPTASLDEANKTVVVELIEEAKAAGSALVGIFHDEALRAAVGTRVLDVTTFKQAA
jgi:alpha-D-ribose 1-methylphosphonate 5-triphosphate synthase subunit PhnL